MKMLKIGDCINILIDIVHIICFFNPEHFIEVIGVGEKMRRNAEIHLFPSYAMTIYDLV
ncbi:MAG: hypothetical protein QM660_14760 [Dysgonomonas sp.]